MITLVFSIAILFLFMEWRYSKRPNADPQVASVYFGLAMFFSGLGWGGTLFS